MTITDTLVDVLHVLRDVRRERHVYREIALCAIHRLHEQHVVIARQRRHIRRLCGELHDLRSEGRSHISTSQIARPHRPTSPQAASDREPRRVHAPRVTGHICCRPGNSSNPPGLEPIPNTSTNALVAAARPTGR